MVRLTEDLSQETNRKWPMVNKLVT